MENEPNDNYKDQSVVDQIAQNINYIQQVLGQSESNMSPDQFCYWLQGFFELTNTDSLTPQQVQMIKDHLSLVFTKVTPTYTLTQPIYPPSPNLPDPRFIVTCGGDAGKGSGILC